MPNTLQDFLGTATQRASTNLVIAFLQLPDDKRAWSPSETARTALDQVAECAILNDYTAEVILKRQWRSDGFAGFLADKDALIAQGWEALQARLEESALRVSAAVSATPEDALQDEIALPWGNQTLAQMLAYPYWNMSYHEAQINYLASILGCLK